MRAECFSGKCIYFGYVVAEPGCGCLGVLHEVVVGVLGDCRVQVLGHPV